MGAFGVQCIKHVGLRGTGIGMPRPQPGLVVLSLIAGKCFAFSVGISSRASSPKTSGGPNGTADSNIVLVKLKINLVFIRISRRQYRVNASCSNFLRMGLDNKCEETVSKVE